MKSCLYTLNSCARRRLFCPSKPDYRPVFKSLPPLRHRSYASISATELHFGQPLHETHPHILKSGELTPGITALEYAQRRSKLAAKLPQNAVAILAASDIKYRSGAVFYDFHQESNFFYLTGFTEPEAIAVIGKSSNNDDHIFYLFVRPKDPEAEQWDGARSGTQAALDVFNADESGNINQISSLLSPIVSSASKIYTDMASTAKSRSFFSRFLHDPSPKAEGLSNILETKNSLPLNNIMNEVRNLKSDAEIAIMRKTGQASGRAFTDAMRQVWRKEKDLAAFLDYQFKTQECDGSAYIPVVAGGQNASIIHYTQNNHLLKNGQLVLVDAGGVFIAEFRTTFRHADIQLQEYGGYISDITRTWPISGAFTQPQKDLYDAVLSTQRHCISLCRANASVSLDDLHSIAETDLKDNLSQIGFDMSGKVRILHIGQLVNALDSLFPHHLGHYIGLDVHDTPGLSRKTPLQARQCVTVEPGIYVPNTDAYPLHFRGMGIRIEDSVCVEDRHPLVLTTEAVKEIDDIEALRD